MSQSTQKSAKTTQELKEFEVQVEKKPNCKIELHVKATPSAVEKAQKTGLKTVGKEVVIPGFRKGKAPSEIILKKYPEEVTRQTKKALADLAFLEAQKIANVPVLNNNGQIVFDLKDFSLEEGATLLFSFETEPTVPEIDREKFVAEPIEKAEVGEKQIEEAIRQMRFFYASWKPVTDRAIQDGDYIMIDLDTVDGDKVERVFSQIRFEVSKARMAAWMKKLVEGAKAGDVLEGVSEPDDDATEEEKKEFKPKNVRITILKAEEASLPEVNDEFAKKVGAENVEAMKKSITDLLNKQADDKVHSQLSEQVNHFLTKNYPVELPLSLIETEKKHRIDQMKSDPKRKKEWDGMSQEERAKLEEKLTLESKEAVSLFYISRAIVQRAKIPVTHQEVQNEAISIYRSHSGRNAEVDKLPKELYALALSKVVLAKAQNYILKKA